MEQANNQSGGVPGFESLTRYLPLTWGRQGRTFVLSHPGMPNGLQETKLVIDLVNDLVNDLMVNDLTEGRTSLMGTICCLISQQRWARLWTLQVQCNSPWEVWQRSI